MDTSFIVPAIMTNNPCYTTNQKIVPKGLMLHSVGCPQSKAQNFVNSWNTPAHDYSCVHGFIDAYTGQVYQTLPWDHRGWHAGGAANNTHIGVEMCEPDNIKYQPNSATICSCTDKEKAKQMVTTTYNSAVKLFAYLCDKYNLNPLQDGVIISHNEGRIRGLACEHVDPEHLWTQLGTQYTMDTFRHDVYTLLQQIKAESEGESTSMSKEEFRKMLLEVFSDMAKENGNSWSKDAINWATYNGIVQGDEHGNIMPKKPITREECITLLYRYDQMS